MYDIKEDSIMFAEPVVWSLPEETRTCRIKAADSAYLITCDVWVGLARKSWNMGPEAVAYKMDVLRGDTACE